jgi:hypothetical protein
MLQTSGQRHFASQSLHQGRGAVVGDSLEGNGSPEFAIPCAKDSTHAAACDLRPEFIPRQAVDLLLSFGSRWDGEPTELGDSRETRGATIKMKLRPFASAGVEPTFDEGEQRWSSRAWFGRGHGDALALGAMTRPVCSLKRG